MSVTEQLKKDLISLAKTAINDKLNNIHTIDVEGLLTKYPNLSKIGATFVTLTIHGELRGCMGVLIPHQKLLADIIINAQKAAFEDPRFTPLTQEEFKNIEIEISILSENLEIKYENLSDLKSKINIKQGKMNDLQEEYYRNGKLKSKVNMLNGKINGLQIDYYNNGQIKLKGIFKNSILNGKLYKYYKTGVLKLEGNYTNGKQNGMFQEFSKSGIILTKYSIKNNILNGVVSIYSTNGDLYSELIYKNNILQKGYLYDKKGKNVNMNKKDFLNAGIKPPRGVR